MKLKKGITGFWDDADGQPIPHIEEKKLKGCAYAIYASTDYQLIKILNPETSSNYYRLLYTHILTKEKLDLIVNNQYPYYTGITPDSVWIQLKFVDVPEEIRRIFETEFKFLTPEFLNTSFRDENLQELSAIERQQIYYWKSRTYGEVIFNDYD